MHTRAHTQKDRQTDTHAHAHNMHTTCTFMHTHTRHSVDRIITGHACMSRASSCSPRKTLLLLSALPCRSQSSTGTCIPPLLLAAAVVSRRFPKFTTTAVCSSWWLTNVIAKNLRTLHTYRCSTWSQQADRDGNKTSTLTQLFLSHYSSTLLYNTCMRKEVTVERAAIPRLS